jgi:hypothetical protein
MKIFIFLSMLFCHIIDDYKLQPPLLNTLKQKDWWKENAPDELYKHDYLMALAIHAISWSFMVHLPIAIYNGFHVGVPFLVSFAINAFIHAFIDNLKANKHKINLIVDQLSHIGQISIAFFALTFA